MPRRGENIYKRKDGRWEARYIKQILPDGKKKYGSVYAYSYSEVKDKQKQAISQPVSVSKKNKTLFLQDVYNLWIARVKINAKPNTIIKYEGIFKNHISYLQSIQLAAIDKNIINDFIKHLLCKGLSNKTVNDIIIVLNMLFGFATDEYGINIPKINYLREERKETRYLSVSEQKSLICYLNKDMNIHKFGTLLALYTGIRIGELCALKWEDIENNAITINKTMMRVNTGTASEVVILPPKSESSVRIVPFPIELLKFYKHYKCSGYILSTDRLVFTEPRYMQMKFDKYVKECNLKNVTFHTLRHTFATRCIEAGVDAKTVSELLGHADTKITLNRYVHSSFELKQNSIEKMQKLLV